MKVIIALMALSAAGLIYCIVTILGLLKIVKFDTIKDEPEVDIFDLKK